MAGRPLRVVLDPGHGGGQTGTRGPRGTLEKDVNLRVARELAPRLRALGLQVVLTREGDEERSLDERVAVEGDLWISIHHNATAEGPPLLNRGEFYIPLVRIHPSLEFAREVIRAFQDPRWPFPPHPEPLPATYRVLVPDRVSLLTEACYLLHEDGEAFLLAEGASLEAEILARAVEAFLDRTGGTVPRIREMERRRDVLRFSVEGPVDPSTLEIWLGDERLTVDDDGNRFHVRIPRDFPAGRWTLRAQFFTPDGVPSLPFEAPVSVEQPVHGFVMHAYPLSFRIPSHVRIRVVDPFGRPAPPGLRVGLRLQDGEILERDERTRPGGEVHLVVRLPRGSGVLEVDLPGFSGVGQLTYQERQSYQFGRIRDARTGEVLENVDIQTPSGVFRPLPGGWFFTPGRGPLTFRARGYGVLRKEGASGEDVLLEPLLDGVLHRKLWLEGPPEVVRLLAGWCAFFGADVHIPPEGMSDVDRVFLQNEVRPDLTVMFEENLDEPRIGFFPGVPEERSEGPARLLAHTLHRMGLPHRVGETSFYRLIHYTGLRFVIRRPAFPPEFVNALFAALVHLLGGPEPWKRVVRVHREGEGLVGVVVRLAGLPLWTRTTREGIAHLWSPLPDPQPVILEEEGTLEVLE